MTLASEEELTPEILPEGQTEAVDRYHLTKSLSEGKLPSPRTARRSILAALGKPEVAIPTTTGVAVASSPPAVPAVVLPPDVLKEAATALSPRDPLHTRCELILKLREEHFCEDLELPNESLDWSEETLVAFFENGGIQKQHHVGAAKGKARVPVPPPLDDVQVVQAMQQWSGMEEPPSMPKACKDEQEPVTPKDAKAWNFGSVNIFSLMSTYKGKDIGDVDVQLEGYAAPIAAPHIGEQEWDPEDPTFTNHNTGGKSAYKSSIFG